MFYYTKYIIRWGMVKKKNYYPVSERISTTDCSKLFVRESYLLNCGLKNNMKANKGIYLYPSGTQKVRTSWAGNRNNRHSVLKHLHRNIIFQTVSERNT
jgi:hypothetical protein